MAESSIAWTNYTFNGWWGCTKVGPGCLMCYAEEWDSRWGGDHWGPGKPRRYFDDAHWAKPLAWNRKAIKTGQPAMVFCSSMSDVFDNEVEQKHRDRLWRLIKATPALTWQVLTKRIGNARKMLPEDWGDGYPNVWLMATVVTQEEADRDIPKLAAVPARIHGLSVEPQLEQIDLTGHALDASWWVICGGESGAKARPFQLDWARSLRDQCAASSTPFFMKQLGTMPDGERVKGKADDPAKWPADLNVREYPTELGRKGSQMIAQDKVFANGKPINTSGFSAAAKEQLRASGPQTAKLSRKSDNPRAPSESKVDLRSWLQDRIDAARGAFSSVRAFEADRDQALYEALCECAEGITEAIEAPDVFAELSKGARGRDISTKFIDLASRDDAGESTLGDERRSEYAASAMWFATPELFGDAPDDWDVFDRARALGGIGGVVDDPSRPGIAAIYRAWRDRKANKPPTTEPAKPSQARSAEPDNQESDNPTVPTVPAENSELANKDGTSERRGPHIQRGRNNTVKTAPSFALDIVKHFAPQFKEDDSFLDPCAGDGVFYDAIEEVAGDDACSWCEIDPDTDLVKECGGPCDFLESTHHFDWAITNTPWSADEYAPIFRHALKVCDNIVFLIRVQNATTTARRNEWEAAGFALKEVAICRWQDAGFPPEGLPLAALHWQRGWKGDTRNSKIEAAEHRLERYKGMFAEIVLNVDKLSFDQRSDLHNFFDKVFKEAVGFADVRASPAADIIPKGWMPAAASPQTPKAAPMMIHSSRELNKTPFSFTGERCRRVRESESVAA